MKTGLILLLWLASLGPPLVGSAQTILRVSGSNDLVRVLVTDDAAAAAFTLSSNVSSLAISAELESFGASAVAYLTRGLDVGFHVEEDLIAVQGVSSNLLFTGINLSAGTYFLVIGNYGGALFWHASSSPGVTNSGGAARVVDFFAETAAAMAPASRFTAAVDRALHYELRVVSAPVFAGCIVPASGQFRLRATGSAGLIYTLQSSTNLVHWVNRTNLVAGPDGLVEYLDEIQTNAPALPQRFYRLCWP